MLNGQLFKKKPLLSSKRVFEAACGVQRTSRRRILQRLAVVLKAVFWPPLTNARKAAQIYMKTNFQTVLFTDAVLLHWMVQMDGVERPPCSNKTATSARRWRSDVLDWNIGK